MVDADHFVGSGMMEDDTFGLAVLFDCDNFGCSKNGNAEATGEVICDGITSFFVFAREEMSGRFGEDNFGAELSKVFGDFATSRTATDDHNDFGETTKLNGGVGGKITDRVSAGNSVDFGPGTGGNNKAFGGEFLVINSDGVWV